MTTATRKILLTSIAALLTLGISVPKAEASSIRIVDTFNPAAPVALSGTGASYAFQFDLTLPVPATNTLETYLDGVLTAGASYDPLTDTLVAGTIDLSFGNFSSSPAGTNGRFNLVLDYGNLLSGANFQASFQDLVFDVSAITADGLLSLSIVRTNASGTADFLGSVLDVSGVRAGSLPPEPPVGPESAAVPEPASVALLASGLAVLGARLRKRR